MRERNLIILGILVVLTAAAAGFIFLKNTGRLSQTQTTVDFCKDVQEPKEGIQCRDALQKTLALYPGNVNSIQFTTTKFQEGSTGTPRDINIWLVDINLENPIETEIGTMNRITVAVDITSTIEPFVNQLFPIGI